MANLPRAMSTRTDRARAILLAESGRASAGSVLLSNALQTLDAARRGGEVQISDIARDRLARAAMEASAKLNEFRRVIDELIANQ